MAHATIYPDERLQETNSIVRWLKSQPAITRQQASLLAVHLNGGFLLLDDCKNGTLYADGETQKKENLEREDDIVDKDNVDEDKVDEDNGANANDALTDLSEFERELLNVAEDS